MIFVSYSVNALLFYTAERVESALQNLRAEFGNQHVWVPIDTSVQC